MGERGREERKGWGGGGSKWQLELRGCVDKEVVLISRSVKKKKKKKKRKKKRRDNVLKQDPNT